MSIAVSQTVVGSLTTGNTITLTSWTPAADDLIIVGVVNRDVNDSIAPSLAGNGLNFVKFLDESGLGEARIRLYRAQGSAPTAGSIVVTLTGNTLPCLAGAVRLSGCATNGIYGSGGVEAIDDEDGSSDDMIESFNTISTNALVLAFGTHRDKTFTVPGGETSISVNNSAGAGADTTRLSIWSEATTTPGLVQIGASNDLSAATEWLCCVVSIKPFVASAIQQPGQKLFLDRRLRRLIFKNAVDDYITSVMGWAHSLLSSYSGNEVDGVEVKNSIRVVFNGDLRAKVNQGDYCFLNPNTKYLIKSIKPFGLQTEIIASIETSVPGLIPDVVTPVSLSAATAETVIWQPALGKKFRLMSCQLRISGTSQVMLTFRDGVGGRIILYGTPADSSDTFSPESFGLGILSELVDNALTVERGSSVTLVGHVMGFEE